MDGCRPGWVQKLWKFVSFTAVACFAFNFVPAGGWQWVDSHALSKEWQQHWTSSPLQFDRPKIPAEGKIKLSETILSISRNNKVIVSYATISVLDHLFNFLCHLKQLSLAKHVMVFAADQKVYDILRRKNITAWPAYLSFEVEDPETERVHGSNAFASLSRLKIQLVLWVLNLNTGVEVFYSDVDIAILGDIFAHVESNISSNVDIAFLSDNHVSVNGTRLQYQYLCTGFFFARPSKILVQKLEEVVQYQHHPRNAKRDDQVAVNAILPAFKALKDINVATFDPLVFPNGYTFFHKLLPHKLSFLESLMLVHANYILGHKTKRFQMQLHGLWMTRKSGKCFEDADIEQLATLVYLRKHRRPTDTRVRTIRLLPREMGGAGTGQSAAKIASEVKTIKRRRRKKSPFSNRYGALKRMERTTKLIFVCHDDRAKHYGLMMEETCKLQGGGINYVIVRRSRCADRRGTLVAKAIENGHSILWIDSKVHSINPRTELRTWMENFSKSPDRSSQIIVNSMWVIGDPLGHVRKGTQGGKILASKAIPSAAQHRHQNKANGPKNRVPLSWNAFYVGNLPTPTKKWISNLFSSGSYQKITECEFSTQPSPFLNPKQSISCSLLTLETRQGDGAPRSLRIHIFNPLVVASETLYFEEKLVQHLGVSPLLVRHGNAIENIVRHNLCCNCRTEKHALRDWNRLQKKRGRILLESSQLGALFGRYTQIRRSYPLKEICEFGISKSIPISLFWLQNKHSFSSELTYNIFTFTDEDREIAGEAYEFVHSRLTDRTQLRLFRVENVRNWSTNYPNTKCDLVLMHGTSVSLRQVITTVNQNAFLVKFMN